MPNVFFLFIEDKKNIIEKMTPFLSRYMGEIEYDPQKKDWSCLASSYINQQSYLPLLRLLIQLKRARFTTESWTIYNNRTNN